MFWTSSYRNNLHLLLVIWVYQWCNSGKERHFIWHQYSPGLIVVILIFFYCQYNNVHAGLTFSSVSVTLILVLRISFVLYICLSFFFLLLDGFFNCKSGEMLTGFEYNSAKSSTPAVFKFQAISDINVRRALEIVHLSSQIRDIQSKYSGTQPWRGVVLCDVVCYLRCQSSVAIWNPIFFSRIHSSFSVL